MNTINILKNFRHLYDFQLIHKNKHVGSCKLMIHDKNAVINHIYIDDSHKKQGLGSLLLQETEQILKKDHFFNFWDPYINFVDAQNASWVHEP